MVHNDTQAGDDSGFRRRDFLKGGSLAALMAFLGGVEITAEDKVVAVPKADPNYKDKPPSPPVNFGVIGLGTWGKEMIATLNRMPNAPVVAISDTYASSLTRVGATAPKASQHKDWREVIAHKDVQAVLVATPTHLHKEIVLAALQAGKHVYCEAPLAHTIDDARAIAIAARNAKGLVFQAGHQWRANPQNHHVYKFIRSEACGKIATGRGQWHRKQSWRRASPNPERETALNWRLDKALTTGLVGEQGIHQIDIAAWYFGSHPVAVTGFGSIMQWRDGREIPDTAHAIYEFTGGGRYVYEATLANSFDAAYDVFHGTDAAVMMRDQKAWMFKEVDSALLGWEVYARKEEFFQETGIALVANATKLLAQGKKPAEGTSDSDSPHKYSLTEFVDNIADKKAPSSGYAEAFAATVMAIKGHEATMKNTRIELAADIFKV